MSTYDDWYNWNSAERRPLAPCGFLLFTLHCALPLILVCKYPAKPLFFCSNTTATCRDDCYFICLQRQSPQPTALADSTMIGANQNNSPFHWRFTLNVYTWRMCEYVNSVLFDRAYHLKPEWGRRGVPFGCSDTGSGSLKGIKRDLLEEKQTGIIQITKMWFS